MDQAILKIPSYGIVRHYVLSFVSTIEEEKIIPPRIDGDVIKIQSMEGALPKLFAEAFYNAGKRLRNYAERKSESGSNDGSSERKEGRKPRLEIPASGRNDEIILSKLKRELKLPQDVSFSEAFRFYGDYLNRMDCEEFRSIIEGKKIHSPISIFKPELYGYTRGPYFNGMLDSDKVSGGEAKLSTWEFMVRLAGYVISRVGVTMIPSGNKPIYLTVLALPTNLQYSKSNFELMLSSMNNFPGFKPEEGMIMWMALNLPDYVDELLVVGMKNPAGMSPAEIKIGFNVPLKSYRMRAESFIKSLKENERQKAFQWMIQTAMREKEADSERELLKLLFTASQGDKRSQDELILRSSRAVLHHTESEKGTAAKRLVDFCRNLIYLVPSLS